MMKMLKNGRANLDNIIMVIMYVSGDYMRTHLTPIFEQNFNQATVISLTFDLNKI